MKSSDIAFLTEQLAEMVRAGTPLPGALRQLADDTPHAGQTAELRRLEEDLAAGRSVAEAFEKSRLPAFVKSMVAVGTNGGDLPGMLRRVADYYRRRSELHLRMSGLLVYPILVLVCMLVFCIAAATLLIPHMQAMIAELATPMGSPFEFSPLRAWGLAAVVAALLVIAAVLLTVPDVRGPVSWKIAPFRSRNVAELTSMLAVCLRGGMPLRDAVALLAELEPGAVKREMQRLQNQLANGRSDADALAACSLLPPLAGWMITASGRNLPDGLEAVAELYRRRSAGQTDLLLYTLLPLATVLLGALMVHIYAYPIRCFFELLNAFL